MTLGAALARQARMVHRGPSKRTGGAGREHAQGANRIMKWSVHQIRGIARALAWFGIAAIVVLSVVPADERPVTGIGQVLEHLTAFGLVAGMFAIGYRFTFTRLLLMALLFCGGIELLQVPLPTRHARVSDFAIDLLGSSFAIGLVAFVASRSGAAHSEAANR
jgi:hypothetical protein